MIRLAMASMDAPVAGEEEGGGDEPTEADLAALMGSESEGEGEGKVGEEETAEARLAALELTIAPLVAASKAAKAKGSAAVAAWKEANMATYSALSRKRKALRAEIAATPVQVSCLVCTVTFYANLAHSLTRSP